MRWGICCGPDSAQVVADAGYDYFEPSITGCLHAHKDPPSPEQLRQSFGGLKILPEAFNCFVPGELPVTGPDADLDALRRYVEQVTIIVGTLGGKVIVFGSGGARRVPEGFERERAESQLVDFLKMCGDEFSKRGITLAIEPLNSKDTNTINSVAEGVQFAEKADHPAVMVLADYYHMSVDSQSVEEVVDASGWLAHCHMADPEGRVCPGAGPDDFKAWFNALNDAGFARRVSLECKWQDMAAQAGPALELIKQASIPEEEPEE